MKQFIQRYNSDIIGTISTSDRLVFRGTLKNIAFSKGIKGFLWTAKVLLKDFGNYVDIYRYLQKVIS